MRKTLLLVALIGCGGGGDGGEADARADASISDGSVADVNQEPDGLFTGPEIAVNPRMLVLAAESGGTSAPVELLIQNQGSAPLTVSAIELDPPVAQIDLAGPSDGTIAPNEALAVQLTYTPTDGEELETAVVIRSDDQDEAEVRVPVTARTAERCISASPMEINMGSVNPGARTGRFVLELRNCGDLPLTLTTVSLDGPEQFEWGAVGGGELDGKVIAPGNPQRIEFAYTNNAGLAAGDVATATLNVVSDAANLPELAVSLRVRGGDGPSCIMVLEPERLEFETLRIGLEATLTATVRNDGTAECELASVLVEKTRGPEDNRFFISQGIDDMVLPGGSSYEIGVTFAPVEANPIGDQGRLLVQYRDPHIQQNRQAQAFVTGVGAEALIGSDPMGGINFRQVTATECAGPDLTVRADNVGFVPLDVISYRLDGNCDHFHLLSEPDLAEPIRIGEEEWVEWAFRYQPNEADNHRCDILVTSDAMNFDVLRIPMEGEGTETADRRDRIIVGPLDPRSPARWTLQQWAVEDSIEITIDGEAFRAYDYDDERNQIVIGQRNHPERGAEMIITYDGFCFDRAE